MRMEIPQLAKKVNKPPGMSDDEFIEQILEPLETDIYQDREVLKMYRQRKSSS